MNSLAFMLDDPRKSSNVCSSTAAFVDRNGAQSNRLRPSCGLSRARERPLSGSVRSTLGREAPIDERSLSGHNPPLDYLIRFTQ